MRTIHSAIAKFLMLMAAISLAGCGPGQFPGPTMTPTPTTTRPPTATSTATATDTPMPTASSTSTPIPLDLTETFTSKLYPVSVSYPTTWQVSEDKWQGEDHTTVITLASPNVDLSAPSGDLTEGQIAIVWVLVKGSTESPSDARLIATTDFFGESWLGQNVSLQTERSHIVTLHDKRFAIAVYDGKVDNKAPLLISTYVGAGSLVMAWGSTSPDNLAPFHQFFEAVLVSLNLK